MHRFLGLRCVCVCLFYIHLSFRSLSLVRSRFLLLSRFYFFDQEVTEDRLTKVVGVLRSYYLLYTLVVERVKEKSLYTTMGILLKPCHGWDKD